MRRKCTSSDIALDVRLASKAEAKDCRLRNEFRKQWQGTKDANDLRKGTDTTTLDYVTLCCKLHFLLRQCHLMRFDCRMS